MKYELGFYMDDEGALYLVMPNRKGMYYCDFFQEWKEWTGTYNAFLSWIHPDYAEHIGL